jgi:hypothetical protein
MVLNLYNKWTIIITTLIGPILLIPFALLFTYWSFTSTKTVWVLLFIANIIIGITGLIALLILRNARFFFLIRILYSLGLAAPLIYAVNLLLREYFPIYVNQLFASLIFVLLIEWFISYYFEKNRLMKKLEKNLSTEMIDVSSGVVDLQKPIETYHKDPEKSRIQTMLGVGRFVILLAPVLGSYIYHNTTLDQQTNYIIVVLCIISMVGFMGSGVSGGTLSALIYIEDKENRRFVITKLE